MLEDGYWYQFKTALTQEFQGLVELAYLAKHDHLHNPAVLGSLLLGLGKMLGSLKFSRKALQFVGFY